jgi:hypothetical protein
MFVAIAPMDTMDRVCRRSQLTAALTRKVKNLSKDEQNIVFVKIILDFLHNSLILCNLFSHSDFWRRIKEETAQI